jgi:tRNA(Ile)-lysidine synthase
LRGAESQADAEFVGNLASDLNLPFHLERADLSDFDRNLEQAGRKARLALFRKLIREGQADRIATAHTATDQAETVLLRLLRGTGTTGLSGIRPVTSDGRIRPLLSVQRADVESYLTTRGLKWREDSSNASSRFLRNRVRHEVLPVLRALTPDVELALARTAALAQDEEEFWAEQVAATGLSGPELDTDRLSRLHPALARKVIRDSIAQVKGNLRQVDASHVEEILELASQRAGTGERRIPGLAAVRSLGTVRLIAGIDSQSQVSPPRKIWLRFVKKDLQKGPVQLVETGGIRLEILEIPSTLCSTAVENGYTERKCLRDAASMDFDKLEDALVLRSPYPGDRIQLGGKLRKLKTLFGRYRVPVWDRPQWPVLESGGRIAWIRRFGVADDFAADEKSRFLLRIT